MTIFSVNNFYPTVPEFFISPVNIVVSEATPEVEVCVNLVSILGRSVVVTAETQPKIGATNQATGKTRNIKDTNNMCY